MINKFHTRYCSVCYRSSRPELFCKKGVFRNFAKLTGKHLCQSLFFNEVVDQACNFIKKETLAQMFSCEFCEISNNTVFYRAPPVAASVVRRNTKHKKMKTRESKEWKFEEKVREIGSFVLISCVCFSVVHRSSRWMVEVKWNVCFWNTFHLLCLTATIFMKIFMNCFQ